MDFIGFPKIPRLFRPIVITEKIDGTNAQIVIDHVEYQQTWEAEHGVPLLYVLDEVGRKLAVRAASRTKYIVPQADNHGFAGWVFQNGVTLAQLGPGRHFGEWWGQGINRGYGLKEKRFSLFNVAKWSDPAVRPACCHVVPVVFEADVFNETAVQVALAKLRFEGSLAAPGYMKPEGVVVYHKAGNFCFKVTLENDMQPKGRPEGS